MPLSKLVGVFRPEQLALMQRALARASTSLSVQPDTPEYEALASRLIAYFSEDATENDLLAKLLGGSTDNK